MGELVHPDLPDRVLVVRDEAEPHHLRSGWKPRPKRGYRDADVVDTTQPPDPPSGDPDPAGDTANPKEN